MLSSCAHSSIGEKSRAGGCDMPKPFNGVSATATSLKKV
jgi:hypothetical protein